MCGARVANSLDSSAWKNLAQMDRYRFQKRSWILSHSFPSQWWIRTLGKVYFRKQIGRIDSKRKVSRIENIGLLRLELLKDITILIYNHSFIASAKINFIFFCTNDCRKNGWILLRYPTYSSKTTRTWAQFTSYSSILVSESAFYTCEAKWPILCN